MKRYEVLMDMNRVIIDGTTARIQLTKGVLIMDAEDVHLLKGMRVEVRHGLYVTIQPSRNVERARQGKGKRTEGRVLLHRAILKPRDDHEVDHINHNGLDNRKANIRVCNRGENRRNSRPQRTRKHGPFKGVTMNNAKLHAIKPMKKPWRAFTRVKGKRIWLGYYKTAEEAAMAYNRYAAANFGEFACLNDIPSAKGA